MVAAITAYTPQDFKMSGSWMCVALEGFFRIAAAAGFLITFVLLGHFGMVWRIIIESVDAG